MKKILCIYGLPAAGKTTQAELIGKKYNFKQFGMGDRLRAEVQSGSELGQTVKKFLDAGALITDDLMEQVIRSSDVVADSDGVIFDGFPRIISQAAMLEKVTKDLGLDFVGYFYLNVKPDTAISRIKARAELTHRPDDEDPKVVRNRMDVFAKESIALIEHYKNMGKLIEIDGEQSIEEVFAEIEKHL